MARAPPPSPASLPAYRQASESGNPARLGTLWAAGPRVASRASSARNRTRLECRLGEQSVRASVPPRAIHGRCRRDNARAAVKPATRMPDSTTCTASDPRSFQHRLRRGLWGMLLPCFAVALLAVVSTLDSNAADRADRQRGGRRTSGRRQGARGVQRPARRSERPRSRANGRAHVRQAGRHGAGGVRRGPVGARPERGRERSGTPANTFSTSSPTARRWNRRARRRRLPRPRRRRCSSRRSPTWTRSTGSGSEEFVVDTAAVSRRSNRILVLVACVLIGAVAATMVVLRHLRRALYVPLRDLEAGARTVRRRRIGTSHRGRRVTGSSVPSQAS